MLNHNQNLKTILIFCLITISQPAYSGSFLQDLVRSFNLLPFNWLFSSESWKYIRKPGTKDEEKLFEDSNKIKHLNDDSNLYITSTHVHKRSDSFFVNLYYRALNVRYKQKVSLVRYQRKAYVLKNNNDSLTTPNENDETEYGFMDALRGMGLACAGSLIFSAIIYRLVPKIKIKGVELNSLVAGASLLILPIRQFLNPLGQVSLNDLENMEQIKKSKNCDSILEEYEENNGYADLEKYT